MEPKWVQSGMDYLDLKRWKQTQFHPSTAMKQQKGMNTMRQKWTDKSRITHTRWPFQSESYLTSRLAHYSCLFSFSVIKVKTVLGSWRADLNQQLPHHLSSRYQTFCGQTWSQTFKQVNRSIRKPNLRRKGCFQPWLQLNPIPTVLWVACIPCAKLDSPVVFHTQLAPHPRNKPDAASASH